MKTIGTNNTIHGWITRTVLGLAALVLCDNADAATGFAVDGPRGILQVRHHPTPAGAKAAAINAVQCAGGRVTQSGSAAAKGWGALIVTYRNGKLHRFEIVGACASQRAAENAARQLLPGGRIEEVWNDR